MEWLIFSWLWFSADMGMPFGLCMTGPLPPEGIVPVCTCWDSDGDEDIDLRDFAVVQREGVVIKELNDGD